jgi:hypothetical protein
VTRGLEGISAPQVTRTGGRLGLSNESGAIRLGGNPDERPNVGGKAEPEIVRPKGAGPQGEATVNDADQKTTTIGKQKKADHVKDEAVLPKGSTPAWKASMTSAEAEAYTQGSHYEGKTFYHGTNIQSAQAITKKGVNPTEFDEFSTYGPGFYTGKNHKVALDYAKRKLQETGQPGSVLGVMIKVKKPKIFQNGSDYHRAAAEYIKQSGKINEEWNVAFNNHLRKEGYDGIELSELEYTVVFEQKQVVVTSNEVIK